MSVYLTLADVVGERLEGLLAEERARYENTCCSRCRRGTRAHGNLPCGYDRACPNPNCNHPKGRTR